MLYGKRRKFRLIYQLDMMGCGPSCLAMIMDFYGKRIEVKEISNVTYMSKHGVSLRSISMAAESFGFKTMGGCISIDTLIGKATLPCIAYWEQNHFVVIYKINTSVNFYR